MRAQIVKGKADVRKKQAYLRHKEKLEQKEK